MPQVLDIDSSFCTGLIQQEIYTKPRFQKPEEVEPRPDGSMTYMPTYYEILGLPESLQHAALIPLQTLRGAYKRALLKNHPDKTLKSKQTTYSIDQISEAFNVLSKPTSRDEYDKALKTRKGGESKEPEAFRTGVEIVDLDDLEVDEAQGIWYRGCRCGNVQGFLIAESDLEEAADEGELSVGCRGCSLWLKVLFGVVEDDSKSATMVASTGGND